jgi:hypothetical protein
VLSAPSTTLSACLCTLTNYRKIEYLRWHVTTHAAGRRRIVITTLRVIKNYFTDISPRSEKLKKPMPRLHTIISPTNSTMTRWKVSAPRRIAWTTVIIISILHQQKLSTGITLLRNIGVHIQNIHRRKYFPAGIVGIGRCAIFPNQNQYREITEAELRAEEVHET